MAITSMKSTAMRLLGPLPLLSGLDSTLSALCRLTLHIRRYTYVKVIESLECDMIMYASR